MPIFPLNDDPRFLSFLLKTTHSAPWEYDSCRGGLIWTKEHYQMYGLDARVKPSLVTWSRCVHPDDRPAFLRALSVCVKSVQDCDIEFRYCHRFRGTRWFRVMAQPGADAGKGARIIGLTQDITGIKAAQEVMRQGGKRLERLARERNEEFRKRYSRADTQRRIDEGRLMAEVMANGLRNPLAALKLAVFNLKKKHYTPFNFDQFAHIDRKLEESARAIQNMITYFSVGMPVYGRVSVDGLVKEGLSESRRDHPGMRVEISACLEKISGIGIEADSAQVRQLFRHVFDNAFEASNKRICRIHITGDRGGAGVSIGIRDNGCGIPRENLPHVFTPLYTTKTKGEGLGLAICRQIASLHNGTIDASSRKGRGTTVSISLPYTACPLR